MHSEPPDGRPDSILDTLQIWLLLLLGLVAWAL